MPKGKAGENPGQRPTGRIFLANVGANRSHPVQSPLFPDGTFELVPIPEGKEFQFPPVPRYADIPCFNRDASREFADRRPASRRFEDRRFANLGEYLPDRFHDVRAHRDPDFENLTYGDLCHYAPRAAGLKQMRPGDLLFFLARLVPFQKGRFVHEEGGFFLTGMFEIEEILREVRESPKGRWKNRVGRNAHVLRGRVDPGHFDGFWVFTGSRRSLRFRRAVRVDRRLADRVFRDAQGRPWDWERSGQGGNSVRSELQVIGSYTRSCRMVIDPDTPQGKKSASVLFSAIRRENPQLWGKDSGGTF